MIIKEELDGIDIDDIVGILKYSWMMESLLEVLTKRRSQAFQKHIGFHSVTNVLGVSISSISM